MLLLLGNRDCGPVEMQSGLKKCAVDKPRTISLIRTDYSGSELVVSLICHTGKKTKIAHVKSQQTLNSFKLQG